MGDLSPPVGLWAPGLLSRAEETTLGWHSRNPRLSFILMTLAMLDKSFSSSDLQGAHPLGTKPFYRLLASHVDLEQAPSFLAPLV